MKLLKRLLLLLMTACLCVLFQRIGFAKIAMSLPSQNAENTPAKIAQGAATSAAERNAVFIEADQLYRQGDVAAAENLYRQVKPAFDNRSVSQVIEPIYEAEDLASADLAYWNAAQTAIANNQTSGAIVALQQLFSAAPGFIPAPLQLAQILKESDRSGEALEVLEQAATIHPYSSDIIMAQVDALADDGQHLEASIAARSFAIINLDHPLAGDFTARADEELNTFVSSQNFNNTVMSILNVSADILPDILGGGLLGDIFGGGGSSSPTDLLEDGEEIYNRVASAFANESELGDALAEEYKQYLTLVDDPEIIDYVTQLGLEVAQLMGRDFDYEFFVVRDNSLNAFALPGGKVFVNTGAILGTHSQAELAGLMGHEVAHAALSHGLQKVNTNGLLENLITPLVEDVPYGDTIPQLISAQYSQQQERQSDILGTRVLATSGYAADGLRNFMVTIAQNSSSGADSYLSTHPAPSDRVAYLEGLIQTNGYNRFALEGVDRHQAIQARL